MTSEGQGRWLRLRALAALAEDLGSVSCTYLAAHNCLKLGLLLLTSSETLHIHAGKTLIDWDAVSHTRPSVRESSWDSPTLVVRRSDGGRVETGGILQRAPKSELERWVTYIPEVEALSQSGLE